MFFWRVGFAYTATIKICLPPTLPTPRPPTIVINGGMVPLWPKINGFHWGYLGPYLWIPCPKNTQKTGDFGVTLPSQVPYFGGEKMFGNPHSNMEITTNHFFRSLFNNQYFNGMSFLCFFWGLLRWQVCGCHHLHTKRWERRLGGFEDFNASKLGENSGLGKPSGFRLGRLGKP